MSPPTIQQALKQAHKQLSPSSNSAHLDAEVLLCFLINKPRSYLHTWPEKHLSDDQHHRYEDLITRRLAGEPVAYITGRREFWSLDLEVNPTTLIPRPDTETLVEWVLNQFPHTPIKVADLGTGSGAIALALAQERPNWQLLATDYSVAALALAQGNAERLNIHNISFSQHDWLEDVDQYDFDLIVSNPPYIPEADPHLLQGDVRFEPRSALSSGATGLDDIRKIIQQAPAHLKPAGWLALEHGYDQGNTVKKTLQLNNYQSISTIRDIAGNNRISVAQHY
ncbi:MAG: peptide chain release factor N(5)-glutamine methyltransferase [Gammaproteobacteria bacterium]|nr:peptide chain release factor N(5)-glutamine methyltransferase [Gammaproteobacteria bacterium]